MPALRSLAHARTILALAGLAALAATAASLGVLPASGASSAVVVTMDVPSATQLTNQCTAPTAASFGTILPGTPGTTATGASVCRFAFASSNATAQLRIRQSDAGIGTTAMASAAAQTEIVDEGRHHTAVSIQPGLASTAWAVDRWGGATRTTNSGASWSLTASAPTSVTGNGCEAIRAVSATTAWVGCGVGKVARTVTTGGSWVLAGAPPTTRDITALGAATASAAVIGTNTGEVFWTNSSGTTWTAATGLPVPGTGLVEAIDMFDASNGFLELGWSHQTYRTNDGGSSWTLLTPTGWNGTCFDLDAVSATVAWLSCDGGHVELTNGGTTLVTAGNPGIDTLLNGITATSATSAIAVGRDGTTLRTTNGGTSWIDETAVTLSDLDGVAMLGSTVYAAGAGDLIVGSGDTGDTWAIQNGAGTAYTLTGVDMLDASVAWAVGERGRIRRTADGGATWATQASGIATHLRDVVAISATTAVAVGDGGVVLRTTNSGTSWSLVPSGTPAILRAIAREPLGTNLVAVGAGGVAIRSEDAGATWISSRTSASGSETLRDVTILGNGTMVLVGDPLALERSVDGGRTWLDLPTPAPFVPGEALVAVSGSGDGSTLFASSLGYGRTYRSTDSGATWVRAPGTNGIDRGAAIRYHGNGVVTGVNGGAVWDSGDLAATTVTRNETYHHLVGYDAVDPARSIAVGQGGNIVQVLPGATIADYGGGNLWGSGGATSMFGVCLQAVGGSALADWTVDASNTSGKCESLDTDPWRAVTATPSIAAHTASIGASGTADLVWGMRSAAATPAGAYRAKVLVEVLGV